MAASNQDRTICPDARVAKECYVAELDISVLGSTGELVRDAIGTRREDTRVILLGDLQLGSTGLGRLIVRTAWVSPESVELRGKFVKVKDNGVRCVAAPCPSYDEELVNRGSTQWIHGFNLTEVPATERAREQAWQAVTNPNGLLLAGEDEVVEDAGPAGAGIFFQANQFFLPINPVRLPVTLRPLAPRRTPRLPVPEAR